LEGLAVENVGIFDVHLVYFTAIGNNLWPFGIVCDCLVIFSPFWYVVSRKIWQPWYIYLFNITYITECADVDFAKIDFLRDD
jgi:hypothetical protein